MLPKKSQPIKTTTKKPGRRKSINFIDMKATSSNKISEMIKTCHAIRQHDRRKPPSQFLSGRLVKNKNETKSCGNQNCPLRRWELLRADWYNKLIIAFVYSLLFLRSSAADTTELEVCVHGIWEVAINVLYLFSLFTSSFPLLSLLLLPLMLSDGVCRAHRSIFLFWLLREPTCYF